MEKRMLEVINHTSKYNIMKDDCDIYSTEKHRLPCWKCLIRPTCFSEKKENKWTKYVRYTVKFENSCIWSILVMDLINIVNSNLLALPLKEIDDMDITNLLQVAIELLSANEAKLNYDWPTAYVMFIRITQRESNNFVNEIFIAYSRLGHILQYYFKEIDHAIDLYSKAIESKPKELTLPYILTERGACFNIKNNTNALRDYKKETIKVHEYRHYYKEIIKEFEKLLGI